MQIPFVQLSFIQKQIRHKRLTTEIALGYAFIFDKSNHFFTNKMSLI